MISSPSRFIQVKMMNGESIIGILANIDLQNSILVIQDPYKIYTGKVLTEEGPVTTVSIAPWFEFETDNPVVKLHTSQIVAHAFLSRDGAEQYIKILQAENNPQPPTLPGEAVTEEEDDTPPDKAKMN